MTATGEGIGTVLSGCSSYRARQEGGVGAYISTTTFFFGGGGGRGRRFLFSLS